MSPYALADAASAINLDHPGTYLSWSFIDISVANLIVIGVMVVIFGLALLVPFPVPPRRAACGPRHRHHGRGHRRRGTSRTRLGGGRSGRRHVDHPRATSRAAAAAARASCCRTASPPTWLPGSTCSAWRPWPPSGWRSSTGFALALGGPDWYHYNSVGHFFNSMHLWSVELFMAFMVIHLWGKFWMAAWRGRRAMTWITGVVAFAASVVECFTGYLSQSNFDSQWIATNGKDAFNAVGVGAFFNVMNFGQMLMWHIVLIPIVLVAIVGAHVLMVRVRGVAHPLPARAALRRARADRKAAAAADAAPWRGATRRYDILKEGTVAVAIASVLVLLMAGLLSSPDLPPLSVRPGRRLAPLDFVGTAAAELDGTALAASYGPPYNNGTSAVAAGRARQLAEAGRSDPADQRRPDLRHLARCPSWPRPPPPSPPPCAPTPAPRRPSS